MTFTGVPPESVTRHETRNIVSLGLAQAIGGSSQPIVVAVSGLVGVTLAPDPSLATLPITVMIVAVAIAAPFATKLLYTVGRRTGFMIGAGAGIVAGALSWWGVVAQSFGLFLVGMAFIGAGAAFMQQYRFALADSVLPDRRARAMSLAMLGGVASGFLGPRLSYYSKDLFPGAEFAGSFLTLVGLSLITIAILSFTRLAPVADKKTMQGGRTMHQLARSPEIFVPMVTGMLSYGLMTFVMVGAPLAMVYVCFHSVDEATTAIQWHIIAMFLPGLVTGLIIRKIGAHLTVAAGLTLIMVCGLVNLTGITVWHFYVSLVLLGVGWNFGFIGSTALLAAGYRPEEAGRAQSLNEPFVFGMQALASVGSGVVLNIVGWEMINVLVLPVAAAGVALVAWGGFRRGPLAPART